MLFELFDVCFHEEILKYNSVDTVILLCALYFANFTTSAN